MTGNKRENLWQLKYAIATLIASSGLIPISALAAQLEEVIVTAQKREQSLGDVPISIISVSGDQLRATGQTSLEDLSVSIPNFTFSEAASGSDNIFMRGVGSGINYGFEQAVGQVIDGFFFGRSRFGRGAFLDIERIEVLKGPQGALLGKNTTAGAINITTAKPTDEFIARVQGAYFYEGSEGAEFDGAVSGPLTDNIRGRLALRYEDRDGFIDNVLSGQQEQKSEQTDFRAMIAGDLNDRTTVLVSYQYGDSDKTGRVGQLSECGVALRKFDPDGPGPAPAGALFNSITRAGEDCTLNYKHAIVNQRGGPVPQRFDNEYQIAGITLEWAFDSFDITSLTGYSDYEFLDDFDADWTPATLAGVESTEDYAQWSQEIRVTSTQDDAISYIAGLYYLSADQKTDFRRDFAALPPPLTTSGNLISSDQDAETIAVFGQLGWKLNESFELVVGARYTDESKDIDQLQTPTRLFSNEAINLVPPAGPAAGRHLISDNRSESDFSPSAALQWYASEDAMLYVKAARGFKGGGYDFQNDGRQEVAEKKFEYDGEDVTSYEIGAKLSLLDGAAELNLAAFTSEFTDLQVSTLDTATITFNVGNAAEATSEGLEMDFRWAATDGLMLSGALAYLKAEYDEFPGAPCSASAILKQGCMGFTDLSGDELPFSPEWSGFIRADYRTEIVDGYEASIMVQASYTDDFALVLDLDEELYQESYTKIDARVAFGSSDGKWEIALLGRNLTDEKTRNFGNDALGGPFMLGSYFSHVEAPRTLAVQAIVQY